MLNHSEGVASGLPVDALGDALTHPSARGYSETWLSWPHDRQSKQAGVWCMLLYKLDTVDVLLSQLPGLCMVGRTKKASSRFTQPKLTAQVLRNEGSLEELPCCF